MLNKSQDKVFECILKAPLFYKRDRIKTGENLLSTYHILSPMFKCQEHKGKIASSFEELAISWEDNTDKYKAVRKWKNNSFWVLTSKAGLRLNIKKTKVMTTTEIQNVNIDNEYIKVVKDFAFLG